MKIGLLENATEQELDGIRQMVGEAFVTNELFHEFGDPQARRALVHRYMAVYTDYVYESKALYVTEDRRGVIGLMHSRRAPVLPQVKMLLRLLRVIPFRVLKRYLAHIGQIAYGNRRYASAPHVDVLFVCVDGRYRGRGYARELVAFAQDLARRENAPLLFDTDMQQYAQIYRHYGCELYHQKTADNGVTRYNLVWKPESDAEPAR